MPPSSTRRTACRALGLTVALLLTSVLPAQSASAASTSLTANYAGYATAPTTGMPHDVQMQWTVPAVSCGGAKNSLVAVWSGLVSTSNKELFQTGTDSGCNQGKEHYSAWYEHFPATGVTYSAQELKVDKNQLMAASVSANSSRDANGNQPYSVTLSNLTTHKSQTRMFTSRDGAGTGECIVEAPRQGQKFLYLAPFGTITLQGCQVSKSYEPNVRPEAWLAKPATASDSVGNLYQLGAVRSVMDTPPWPGQVQTVRALTSFPRIDGRILVTWKGF